MPENYNHTKGGKISRCILTMRKGTYGTCELVKIISLFWQGLATFANLRQNRHYLQLCKALTPAFPVHFLIENPDGENMSDIWIARLSKQELRGTHEQAEEDVNNITLYVPPPYTTNICQSSDRYKFRDNIFNDFETVLSKWERISYYSFHFQLLL